MRTLLLLVVLAVPAAAQDSPADVDPIQTDRPDQTESTGAVPRGFFQVEAGWTVAQDVLALPETLVRVGVARRLELRGGFGGWQRTDAGSGPGDLEVGFKYQLMSRARSGIALMADVALPSGSARFSEGRVAPVVRLSVSHELSEWVGTGYNVGLSLSHAVEAIYTWTVAVALAERLGVFAETFGTLGVNAAGTSRASFDAGFTYQVQPNLQLDLAGGVGLTAAADDWFFGTGVSLRIPR